MLPSQRTKLYLERWGILCGSVERWISQARRRVDLFGFIDLIALNKGIVGIQCTTLDNASARVAKICRDCRKEALAWLDQGGRIEVWGWRKIKDGPKRRVWSPKIVEVTREMVENGGQHV